MSMPRGTGPQDWAGWLARLAATYALGGAVGGLAYWLHLPLPWMLGPFFTFAALTLLGRRFVLLPLGRELAQVAIGLAIGLRFTEPVVATMVRLLPLMILAAIYLLVVTTTAAFLFRRLAGVDPATAFFATAAGGVADMAVVAERFGGAPSSVAVVQAMRVSLVVATAPFIVLGTVGRPAGGGFGAPFTLEGMPLLLVGLIAAYLTARLLKHSPLPNPWLVGPILAGMLIALLGHSHIVVPGPLIIGAQVVLGLWLGTQFKRELMTALPRVTASAVVIAGLLIAMAALGGAVIAATGALPFATAFLSLAPAAVTEMVLTASVMHLDAETVAAFHVMRIIVVSTSVLGVYRIYRKIGGPGFGP